MARIPESELQRLKSEISVQRLIEASGVELKKGGKDFMGVCPFHADETASLVVTPHKNLWHCFGCQIGGGVIDWVIKRQGVSFRHAVELLSAQMAGGLSGVGNSAGGGHSSLAAGVSAGGVAATSISAGTPPKRSTTRTLPSAVAFDADDQALLQQTVAYYHERLASSAAGVACLAYLASRGLSHPGLIDAFQLGVADRTLGLTLPAKNRKDGSLIRARLQKLGLIRASGHEHFNGSLVIPILDAAGQVTEIYGRKLRDDLREGTPKHLYLKQPSEKEQLSEKDEKGEKQELYRPRGVFNIAGVMAAGAREAGEAGGREVILCEALIDALSFWCAGFTNVTSSYGIEGFTDDILQALKANGIERILIAYDRDAPGDKATAKLAPLLIEAGFEVLRVVFPQGMDANAFACKMTPASQSLALVLRQAQWMGGARKPPAEPSLESSPPRPPDLGPRSGQVVAAGSEPSSLAAEPVQAVQAAAPEILEQKQPIAGIFTAQSAPKTVVNELPRDLPSDLPTDLPDEVQMATGACTWRIRAWKKNTSPEAMRVNVQVRCGEGYFVDSLDLFAAKSRQSFVRAASIELGLGEDALKRELGAVLLRLEALQDALMLQAKGGASGANAGAAAAPVLTADEEQAALALLRAPDLMSRIVADLHALGVVGEAINLQAAYLAAVSRKLDSPLAVLIQSTSAAGKSALMDAVLSLMPEEQCLRYSAMTGQSLYYLGEHNLAHKILAISEEEGVRQAAYALKLLQSEGTLTIASTAKDEQTGSLVTKQYSVRGPVMLMLTTTAIDVDEELLNRCLVLSVNESREQTAAIHARQRHKQTLAGLLQGADKAAITALHHNAQRLLSSVAVVNPYADRLSFLSDKTRTRRDHMKYLTLIRAIALLHQHQRPVKTVEHRGQSLNYIEVIQSDIALANQLAHEVLGRTLDELPPQTRNLLVLLRAWCRAQCKAQAGRAAVHQSDWRFSRKALRAHCHWGDTQLKVHLARLVELEHVLMHRRGLQCDYELVYDAQEQQADEAAQKAGHGSAHMNGLIDASTLGDASEQNHAYDTTRSGSNAIQSGSGRPQVGGMSGVGRGAQNTPPERMDIDVSRKTRINGAKPHSSALSSLAAGHVIAA